MNNCKVVSAEFDANQKYLKSCGSDRKNNTKNFPYPEAIGYLLYAFQGTRPDISYVVNFLSKFNNNPNSIHWSAVKRVFR